MLEVDRHDDVTESEGEQHQTDMFFIYTYPLVHQG